MVSPQHDRTLHGQAVQHKHALAGRCIVPAQTGPEAHTNPYAQASALPRQAQLPALNGAAIVTYSRQLSWLVTVCYVGPCCRSASHTKAPCTSLQAPSTQRTQPCATSAQLALTCGDVWAQMWTFGRCGSPVFSSDNECEPPFPAAQGTFSATIILCSLFIRLFKSLQQKWPPCLPRRQQALLAWHLRHAAQSRAQLPGQLSAVVRDARSSAAQLRWLTSSLEAPP